LLLFLNGNGECTQLRRSAAEYKLNCGYNRDTFSLVTLQPGLELSTVQLQLQALATPNQNR
jgi:hypothetical protein